MLFAQPIGLKRSVGSSEATESESARFRARQVVETQFRPQPGHPHMRAGLMPLDPAAFDRECQARSKIAAGAAGIAKEWAVDDSEEDAAVLHGLDAAGALACRGFRISERVAAPYVIPPRADLKRSMLGGVVRGIGSGRSISRGDRAKFPPFTS